MSDPIINPAEDTGHSICIVRITLKSEDSTTDFINAFRDLFIHCNMRETGTTLYELHQSKSNPKVMIIMEKFSNQKAVEAHQSSEEYKAFVAKVSQLPFVDSIDKESASELMSWRSALMFSGNKADDTDTAPIADGVLGFCGARRPTNPMQLLQSETRRNSDVTPSATSVNNNLPSICNNVKNEYDTSYLIANTPKKNINNNINNNNSISIPASRPITSLSTITPRGNKMPLSPKLSPSYGTCISAGLYFLLETILCRTESDRLTLFMRGPGNNLCIVANVGANVSPVTQNNHCKISAINADNISIGHCQQQFLSTSGANMSASLSTRSNNAMTQCMRMSNINSYERASKTGLAYSVFTSHVAVNLSTVDLEDVAECHGPTVAKNTLVFPIYSYQRPFDVIGVIQLVNRKLGTEAYTQADELLLSQLTGSIACICERYSLFSSSHNGFTEMDTSCVLGFNEKIADSMRSTGVMQSIGSPSPPVQPKLKSSNSHQRRQGHDRLDGGTLPAQSLPAFLVNYPYFFDATPLHTWVPLHSCHPPQLLICKSLTAERKQLVYRRDEGNRFAKKRWVQASSMITRFSSVMEDDKMSRSYRSKSVIKTGTDDTLIKTGTLLSEVSEVNSSTATQNIQDIDAYITTMDDCWKSSISDNIRLERMVSQMEAQLKDAKEIILRKQQKINTLKDVLVEEIERNMCVGIVSPRASYPHSDANVSNCSVYL